ncbi:hypothetical protein B7R24_10855 [Subtercola boreus]|nr:hypothetical protein B7R24_10855 [Subtercola boreus]
MVMQIAADALGVDASCIDVRIGDTALLAAAPAVPPGEPHRGARRRAVEWLEETDVNITPTGGKDVGEIVRSAPPPPCRTPSGTRQVFACVAPCQEQGR